MVLLERRVDNILLVVFQNQECSSRQVKENDSEYVLELAIPEGKKGGILNVENRQGYPYHFSSKF